MPIEKNSWAKLLPQAVANISTGIVLSFNGNTKRTVLLYSFKFQSVKHKYQLQPLFSVVQLSASVVLVSS